MKKKYVTPSATMIEMETEQTVMTLSSYNTTGDENQPGVDIIEGNPDEEDGTDLTNPTNRNSNWAKPHNVWE